MLNAMVTFSTSYADSNILLMIGVIAKVTIQGALLIANSLPISRTESSPFF